MNGMVVYSVLRMMGLGKYKCMVIMNTYDIDYFKYSSFYLNSYEQIVKREFPKLFPKVYIK